MPVQSSDIHLFCLTPLHTGFSKASLSMDASEENDGYSSAEDPLNSDPEDEGKKLVGRVASCGNLTLGSLSSVMIWKEHCVFQSHSTEI